MNDRTVTQIHSPSIDFSFKIPFFEGYVPAGFPSPADDYVESPLNLHDYVVRNEAATFFVRVSGDSMKEAGIHEGDVLVVDRSLDATPGRIVIAVVNEEMTVKRLTRLNDQWALTPENEAYPPIILEEPVELRIWGVVTHVLHSL